MKIIIMIGSIAIRGGAEKVVSNMANYWAEKDWDVTIATLDDGQKSSVYPLNSQVKHDCLCLLTETSNLFKSFLLTGLRMKRITRYYQENKPDVIISFTKRVNIIVILATLRIMIPVIISERNNPSKAPIDPLSNVLRKLLYPKASSVVCQTQDMLDYFLPSLRKNSLVIPNPILKPNICLSSSEIPLPEGKIIFAIGSMSKHKIRQKGFDLLIPVFNNLSKKFDDWNLMILGDGSERIALLNKVKELKLIDRVILPGNIKDIYSILPHGDLFVLSSRYEGFPNALCEAMACGLPAVSFDCPTGPSDIIRNAIDGLLVPPEDIKSLEYSMETLMANRAMREEMGLKAKEVVDRFSLHRVMGLWENLINKLLSG